MSPSNVRRELLVETLCDEVSRNPAARTSSENWVMLRGPVRLKTNKMSRRLPLPAATNLRNRVTMGSVTAALYHNLNRADSRTTPGRLGESLRRIQKQKGTTVFGRAF